MPATAHIEISLTETPQFKRLVQFAADVLDHAHTETDIELQRLVDDCYRDLLAMRHADD